MREVGLFGFLINFYIEVILVEPHFLELPDCHVIYHCFVHPQQFLETVDYNNQINR